ncbi:UDP-glucose 6-dehydrogenase [Gimesia panareensis]|uniref:UDP-glucose 6-dehydrogenase n=1 Tax=Gimesia panareensis TaxID=2527978 RepID=A0A517Q633_9PLAN|nr:UDP-glucose/GDP-mannose dehydrogenase family protein [Gimesia panareensis]QDT27073.1 UDP-glucose 6-dehydrogenase [Gimesia panareensis]QDV16633.1 UDP-glucose 6-dehydrogenase [Gimesia panareensis]
MKIAVIGTGYVGLVTGTCFSESGNYVTCIDIDETKVQRLQAGEIPIYEPGLEEMVKRNTKAGRLMFTTSYEEVIPESKCIFIAVGTPMTADGSANLSSIWKVAESLAPLLPEDAIVIIKSTVPVGTNRKLAEMLKSLTGREVDVASNPEFLKEGAAIEDFSKPDRVVVGVSRPEITDVLHELYKPFLRTEHPFLSMELESAEMTKYVANCMLATKISFINEMANLCERVGADINQVRRGIGHDQRIGFSFLFPGVGYGGSCFPKDVSALISVANDREMVPSILNAVDQVNTAQKRVLFEKINRFFEGELAGKTIAIWGLAFKPKTDDIREAPALVLIDQLLEAGVSKIKVHDPVAMENVRAEYGDKLSYYDHHYDTLDGADALAIVTEWNEFRHADFDYIRHKLTQPVIFDGRNLYDPAKLKARGIKYYGIGLSSEKPEL